MRTCVIIPSYNEAAHIRGLVEKVRTFCPDVLVVDDGSEDATTVEARAAGAEVITHPFNMGKGTALENGYNWAIENAFEALVTMDGDAQHDPAEIPLFLECAGKTGADVVLGNRMDEVKTMPFVRWLTNVLTSALVNVVGGTFVHDSQVGYRLIRTRIIPALKIISGRYAHETEIVMRAARKGFIVREVPIRTIYLGGPSKIHPVKDTIRFFRVILQFFK